MSSIPESALKMPLKEQQLATISKCLSEWQVKGSVLGLSEGEMEDIKEDYKFSNEMQKVAMLRKWAKKSGDQATLQVLIDVAHKYGWDEFAENMCKSLGYTYQRKAHLTRNYVFLFCSLLFFTTVMVVLSAIYWESIKMIVYKPFSPMFPSVPKNFVGRNEDIEKLLQYIDFSNDHVDIVNIVGSPGIGKSALAIYIGNEMIQKGAIAYYVNMAEFPRERLKKVLASKILSNWNHENVLANITFDTLLQWAYRRWFNTLIVLDNCDNCIRTQFEPFQEAIEGLLEFSNKRIKIITTSREILMHIENFKTHKVQPLDKESACLLLERRVPNSLKVAEKKKIADLTGEVPLALQIIGALLSVGVNPPSPSQIIKSLKKNPIPTLSPIYLRRSLQLDASISLSYDYLNIDLQRLGCYLAQFPGSFDEEAVFGVLSLVQNHSKDFYLNALQDLVARSMLELDGISGRYMFHKLIRSFFLTRVRLFEAEAFLSAHRHYFSYVLSNITNEFARNSRQALVKLDQEQHNILLFMVSLHRIWNYHHNYFALISSFYTALQSKILTTRFSIKELIPSTYNIINNLEISMFNEQKKVYFAIYFKMYTKLIVTLTSFLDYIHGREYGLLEVQSRISFIENMKHQNDVKKECSFFYTEILRSYEDLLSEESIKFLHKRIVEGVEKIDFDCRRTMFLACDYIQLATAYFSLNNYNNSALFYEKAFASENDSLFPVYLRMYYLYELWLSYLYQQETSKRNEVQMKLLELFKDALEQPSSIVFQYVSYYLTYISFLTNIGEAQKAFAIQEKLVDSMKEMGMMTTVHTSIPIILKLIKILFDSNDFEKIVKLANYGLYSMENVSMVHEYIGLILVRNKAVYLAGNTTEASILFEELMKYLISYNLTESYSQDYTEVCYYLVGSGQYAYLWNCYFNKILYFIHKSISAFIYVIFKTPFGKAVIKEFVMFYDMDIKEYPSITQQSKETTLLLKKMNELTSEIYDTPIMNLQVNLITVLTNSTFRILEKSNFVRFVLNFMSILVRILLIYGFCIFLVWFIRRSYCFFVSTYNKVLFVVAFCIILVPDYFLLNY